MTPKLSFSIIALYLLCLSALTAGIQNPLPSADKDGIDAVKAFARNLLSEAEVQYRNWGGSRTPSPSSWTGDIIYSIQVDRFNNGDTANDNENLPPQQASDIYHQQGANLKGIHEFRHGGDIQGIIDRLDYLKDLGVNSLWITPVFKHNGDYHGYCTSNPIEIDPGFGTNELFRALVKEAHNRNIKIIMDIVINHLCDRETFYSTAPDHEKACINLNSNSWSGNAGAADGQGFLQFSDKFFPPLRSNFFFNRAGPNSVEDMQGTGPAAIFGDFVSGMFDYSTNNYDFQEIFTDLISYWIAFADVDGFRLDAAKHVTEDFLAYFCSKTRNYAASLGKENFYIVGEVAGPPDWIGSRVGNMFSNPRNPEQKGNVPRSLTNRIWSLLENTDKNLKSSSNYLLNKYFPHPGLTAAYDFGHGGTARQVFRNEISIKELAGYFESQYYKTIEGQFIDTRVDWNVLEIHDWPRFLMKPFENHWKRGLLSIAYLMTARGIPLLYYGQEQGFNQDGHWDKIQVGSDEAQQEVISVFQSSNDALKRQNMFMGPWRLGSAVSEISAMSYVGWVPAYSKVSDWRQDPFLNRDHSLYKDTRVLTNIRTSCKTLQEGEQYYRIGSLSSEKSGIIVFSRVSGGDEIVVIFNNRDEQAQVPEIIIDSNLNEISGKRYVNLRNTFDRGVVVKGKGTLLKLDNGSIDGNSYKIYVKEENLGAWNSDLGSSLCKF